MKLPREGDTIAGKYRLERVIGRGGFATVYEAVDLMIDRHVAAKVLTPGENGYPLSTASRFAREAKSMASLTDPHTIKMFDFGRTEDGVLFMVFELLPGRDLSEHLTSVGTMSEVDTIHVFEQMLHSLREAHGANILHRDIKPANIRIYEYMDDPLCAKLMDFGIARWMGADAASITATGNVIGTIRYMSPEQISGGELTPASDLFTLAVVAYVMLTADQRTSLQLIRDGQLQIPCSVGFERILRTLLRTDPADRFPSASKVLEELAGLRRTAEGRAAPRTQTVESPAPPTVEEQARDESQPEVARPAPVRAAVQPAPDTRRDPMMMGVVAAAAAIAALGGLAVAFYSKEEPPPPASARRLPAGFYNAPTGASAASVDAGPGDAGQTLPSGCGKSVDGDGKHHWASLLVGLRRERYLTYLPQGYDANTRYPVLLMFHSDSSTATEGLRTTKLKPFADEREFVIVAPDRERILAFREGIEPALAKRLIDETAQKYCIDTDRVFVFGLGGGGGGVESVSCEPWVAGVATTSFRYKKDPELCEGAVPKPNLYFAPLRSGHLPVKGGLSCAAYERVVSLETQDEIWRERNHCEGPRIEHSRSEEGVCYTWECDEPYVTCHIDAGHNWVGHTRKIDVLDCDGPQSKFPYLDTMWTFFNSLGPKEPPTEGTPHPGDQ